MRVVSIIPTFVYYLITWGLLWGWSESALPYVFYGGHCIYDNFPIFSTVLTEVLPA